jgi:hypothetical protein
MEIFLPCRSLQTPEATASPEPPQSPTVRHSDLQSPTAQHSHSQSPYVDLRKQPAPRPTTAQPHHAADIPGYIPNRVTNNAPRARNPEIDSSNILSAHRRPRRPGGPNSALFTYYGAFSATLLGINTKVPLSTLSRCHQSLMPAPPKRFKDLGTHIDGVLFREAMAKEMDSCWQKGCFQNTNTTIHTADAEVLPLMWVYTYKFDEDGYFTKAKARLVVRGDLQTQWGDTYAASLLHSLPKRSEHSLLLPPTLAY